MKAQLRAYWRVLLLLFEWSLSAPKLRRQIAPEKFEEVETSWTTFR